MKKNIGNIGIILLAAGASKRMGKPKQLLRFQGETFLKRSVKTALGSGCCPAPAAVVVVLGANASELRREIEEFEIEIVENLEWKSGMGTSIRIGLEKLAEISPEIPAAILMVCDQPFVSVELIEKLAKNFRLTDALISASSYGDTIGVPALFSRRLFPELLKLKAETGAKKVIYEHLESVVETPFEAGAIDIDTEKDYLNLLETEE